MMKHLLIAPMFVGAAVLSAQAPSPPTSSTRPASIEDLVDEVRGLRADIQQMADSSIRAQLLVARLQVQEQRIAGIAQVSCRKPSSRFARSTVRAIQCSSR